MGPHADMPAGFVPLRLFFAPERVHIEVAFPLAIVGRHSTADVRLAYTDVSRRHCRLVFANGQWRVQDLKSLNGVFVNNAPVVDSILYAGDMLRLGSLALLVESATPVRITVDQAETQHQRK